MSEKIDKLNRGDFIKFIENLILNSEQYKRNNDSDSYVIAFDSAWGTGKSYFIDLLIQDVELSCDNMRVVKYNAWENDYCDNAFNPLMYDILKSEHLQFSLESDSDRENLNNLMKSVCKVGEAFGKQIINGAVKKATGIDFVEAIQKAVETKEDIKNFMLREIPNINELNTERETFKNFKKYISNATQWMKDGGIKLVVIIDELDRCKPSFAIQTLEVVKHLFDVENIVFLFAVDIAQLSYSISSIYGQGFDSVGYLCRFFDYIARMPNPDIKTYISEQISKIENIPDVDTYSIKGYSRGCKFSVALSEFMYDMYRSFELTLRDFDTLVQSYKMMLNNFLDKYEMLGAHMIYIFCLVLKYKKPQMFYKIFIDTSSYKFFISNDLIKFLNNSFDTNIWIENAFNTMIDDQILCNIDLKPQCDDTGDSRYKVFGKIRSVQDKSVYITVANYNNGLERETTENLTNYTDTSMGNIIFYPDLMKWDEIKNMTYREYLHKQLEMYNFVDVEKE